MAKDKNKALVDYLKEIGRGVIQEKVMKANEAPEKLYFTSNEKGTHYYTEGIPFEREYIEYTRTDTFIEKACAWLRTHSEVDYFELIPDANYCGAGNLNEKRMIEDFRKYMKGE